MPHSEQKITDWKCTVSGAYTGWASVEEFGRKGVLLSFEPDEEARRRFCFCNFLSIFAQHERCLPACLLEGILSVIWLNFVRESSSMFARALYQVKER